MTGGKKGLQQAPIVVQQKHVFRVVQRLRVQILMIPQPSMAGTPREQDLPCTLDGSAGILSPSLSLLLLLIKATQVIRGYLCAHVKC